MSQSSKDIQDEILKGVDFIVNLQKNQDKTEPSQIIKFDSDDHAHIIRD